MPYTFNILVNTPPTLPTNPVDQTVASGTTIIYDVGPATDVDSDYVSITFTSYPTTFASVSGSIITISPSSINVGGPFLV